MSCPPQCRDQLVSTDRRIIGLCFSQHHLNGKWHWSKAGLCLIQRRVSEYRAECRAINWGHVAYYLSFLGMSIQSHKEHNWIRWTTYSNIILKSVLSHYSDKMHKSLGILLLSHKPGGIAVDFGGLYYMVSWVHSWDKMKLGHSNSEG